MKVHLKGKTIEIMRITGIIGIFGIFKTFTIILPTQTPVELWNNGNKQNIKNVRNIKI